MTAMLMPAVNSYFAIYTLANPHMAGNRRSSPSWDLHATATDRALAISHAKILALQPGVDEVHVKQVEEHVKTGQVSVRNVRQWKRGQVMIQPRTLAYTVIGIAVFGGILSFLL